MHGFNGDHVLGHFWEEAADSPGRSGTWTDRCALALLLLHLLAKHWLINVTVADSSLPYRTKKIRTLTDFDLWLKLRHVKCPPLVGFTCTMLDVYTKVTWLNWIALSSGKYC